MAVKKLVCNIDSDLLEQLDKYASGLHVNRTAAVSVIISSFLQNQKALVTLEELVNAYKSEKNAQGLDASLLT